MTNRITIVEVSDTRDDDSSSAAGYINKKDQPIKIGLLRKLLLGLKR